MFHFDKLYPIPLLGGLALQVEPIVTSNWAAMVGAGGIILVAVVVTLDKIGLLKKFGGDEAMRASAEAHKGLQQSLDSLGGKVDQLTATMNSQVGIIGGLTEELKETNKAVSEVHKWIQVQEEVRKRMVAE